MSHQPRVLVVEDERTIAQAIAARPEAEGFAVDQMHDGLAALDRAATWNPQLVVLDVMLPGLDDTRYAVASRRTGRSPC